MRSRFVLSVVFSLLTVSCQEKENVPREASKVDSKKEEVQKPAKAQKELSKDIGRWRRARPAQDAYTEQLEALGYMEGYENAPEFSGIMRHAKEKTAKGYNFYISGHGPAASLMDMNGRILHQWSYPFEKAFPDEPPSKRKDNTQEYWRRGYLYPNGDVIVIHTNYGTLRLDKDSKPKWILKNKPHHHLTVTKDGKIYVLTRRLSHVPEISKKKVWEGGIDIISDDGKILRTVSILRALLDSDLKEAKSALGTAGDLLHTNSIEVLDGKLAKLLPEFKAGNILLSFRKLNMIAVLDMETEKLVWAKTGDWFKQHDAFVVDEQNLILFNNNKGNKHSSVVVFNPKTDETKWKFIGTREEPFYTSSCGANQMLPNGNVLIVESNFGRAFEVNKEGEIVWEFVSPHRAGEKKELIATLFDVDRVPESFDVSWAQNP